MKTKDITTVAIFTAILCIFSVITVPAGTIPVTMGLFGVLVVSIILGAKRAVSAVFIYLLCGCIGLPVFSGFRGGFQVLAGPTGGYLISYIFIALIVGAYSIKKRKIVSLFLISILGVFISYIFATAHFMLISAVPLSEALTVCIYPFVIFDLIKCLTASLLGNKIKKILF